MKHKRILSFTIFLVLVGIGYLLTEQVFPKNANRYPAFILLILIDLYVWNHFKRKVFTYRKLTKNLLAVFYWFPMFLLFTGIFISLITGSNSWFPFFRIYLYGTVFSFFIVKIFIAVFLLLADIFLFFQRTITWIFSSKTNKRVSGKPVDGMSRYQFIEQIAFASAGILLGGMFTGMLKWVHDFNIIHKDIVLPDIPNSYNGLRIVQISDLHLGSWSSPKPLDEAIDMILSLEADLIVFTGDLVNYSTDEAWRFKDSLSRLTAPMGVYAILGNHDYGDYSNWPSKAAKQNNMDDLYRFYDQINWRLLRNEHVVFDRDGEKLALIGVENWGHNKRFPRYGDIIKAGKGMGKVGGKILLSHDPSHWKAVVKEQHKDIQLMLSGHTHGFQFGIEIPGIKWSPAQYLYEHWAGLYHDQVTNQQLYVNRGLGSIGYPGRIGILPEISLLTLKSIT